VYGADEDRADPALRYHGNRRTAEHAVHSFGSGKPAPSLINVVETKLRIPAKMT
jgi:hypothetical protein